MSGTIAQLRLLAAAARRKRPRQLAGVVGRKARNSLLPRLPVDLDARYRSTVPRQVDADVGPIGHDTALLRSALSSDERRRYRERAATAADGEVTLLGRSRRIEAPASVSPDDEVLAGLPRLWYLKLAALEPLRWAVLGHDDAGEAPGIADYGDAWLGALAREERIGDRVGYLRGFWTPYAVSHRVLTLCRYGAWRGGLAAPVERFCFKNLSFLANNVEWDVGGNHLFDNGTALVVGGVTVPEHGEEFLTQGLAVLQRAVETQFLDDGYHDERSPMYHLSVTTRLLTAISVLRAADRPVPAWLRSAADDACGFLRYLQAPDGRIPLLNDSVHDEAEHLDAVTAYGAALDLAGEPPAEPGDSALHWLAAGELTMLFDAGDSGPATQLGHTHNDPCTILAWHGSHPIVTDTGTFDYQPGERRQQARSVRSHNTVQVDAAEPVAFGGRFRMAGRIETTTERRRRDDLASVTAAYRIDGGSSYRHRRTCVEGPAWLLVWDDVSTGGASVVSRLHAHPRVAIDPETPVRLGHESGPELFVHPFGVDRATVDTGPYFPRFGEYREREVLTLHGDDPGFGYLIGEAESATLDATEGTPGELRVGDDRYDLSAVVPCGQ